MRICIPSIESLPPAARRLAEHPKSALRANESRRRLDPIGNRNRSFLQSLRQITAIVLNLSLDSRLVYNRRHFPDLLSLKFIEHILGKENSLPVNIEAKKLSFRRTVEG